VKNLFNIKVSVFVYAFGSFRYVIIYESIFLS